MKHSNVLNVFFLTGLLLSLPVILTGCGGEDTNTTTVQEAVTEKRTGVLKSLGGMTVGEGTHLLEQNDGITIRLKSLNINLDSDKYLNKKVEVRGTITKATDGKDLMDVKTIDLAEDILTDTTTSVGILKEYQNADMGVKLSYLDNWKVKEETNTITFEAPKPQAEAKTPESETQTPTDTANDTIAAEDKLSPTTLVQDQVIITRYSNPTKKTIEAFLGLPSDPNELITLQYTQTKVGLNQMDGLKKESADKNEIDTYLSRNEYIYKISFKGTGGVEIINNRNTYFSILASFQFIGFTPETENTEETELTPIRTEETLPEADTANNPEPTEEEVTDTPKITVTTEQTTTPVTTSTTASSTSSYGVVSQYIGQTINTIAPEAAASGTWTAYSLEFAKPNYVYVIYGSGAEKRRVLLTYQQTGSELSTSVVSYFKPGETTSWTRVTGENPVESAEKTIITLSDTGAEEAAVVKEGYNYFQSSTYDFQAQYPSNWYYSGNGGSGDVLHHYGFSNKPVENGNELVSIDIVSGSLPAGSPISVGSNQGVKVTSDGETVIYIKRSDGSLYKIHGTSSNEAYIIDVAASIKAN